MIDFLQARYHYRLLFPIHLAVCYGNDMEMKRKTNFDITLKEQFEDKDLTGHFKKAGRTWDAAL
jgi:hypothetical protein